jgi:hypothetical protein
MFQRLLAWLRSDAVLFTQPGVGRMFAICLSCSRVMPHYWAVFTAGERDGIGCRCGCLKFSPANIALWRQVWWLFVRGWLVRKVILRKVRWDPRLPVRMPH